MPPFTGWYTGDANIGELIGLAVPRRLLRHADDPVTEANGQPAFGLYMRTPDGDFEPFHLQVLELDGDRVQPRRARSSTPTLFARFGLPERLPADYAVAEVR